MRLLPLAAAMLFLGAPAWSAETPFLTAAQVDLMRLLAPPPAAGSAQDKADMAEVIHIEQTRTPERAAQATADAKETVFDLFGPTFGAAFTKAALPTASVLFEKIEETEEEVVTPAKSGFGRPRPYIANPALHPVAPTSKSGTYPSGHATRSTVMGIVMAMMVPEQRAAIFARVEDYAESRVIAGVHYRSDIVAGRQAGTAVGAVLVNDPAFKAAFEPARIEVRKALGLAN